MKARRSGSPSATISQPGNVPLVYLQNSGLGNAVNPLLSLADPDVYGVPLVLLIGWRGAPGEADEPQHRKQGRVTLGLLEAMEIPCEILDSQTVDATGIVGRAVAAARQRSGPSAIVVRRGALPSSKGAANDSPYALKREEAIAAIVAAAPPDSFFVATTGMIGARAVRAAGARRRKPCAGLPLRRRHGACVASGARPRARAARPAHRLPRRRRRRR